MVAPNSAETHRADGGCKRETLDAIAESSALSDDIGLQVMDANGKILYDDTLPARHAKEHTPVSTAPTDPESAVTVPIIAADGVRIGDARLWVLGSDALLTKADTAFRERTFNPESAVTVPIIAADGVRIGDARLWVLGSDALLTKADTAFRERTFNAMGLAAFIAISISVIVGFLVSRMFTKPVGTITDTAAFIAISISVIVGFLVSRMFTKPVGTITDTARRIREGDLSARTNMRGEPILPAASARAIFRPAPTCAVTMR